MLQFNGEAHKNNQKINQSIIKQRIKPTRKNHSPPGDRFGVEAHLCLWNVEETCAAELAHLLDRTNPMDFDWISPTD